MTTVLRIEPRWTDLDPIGHVSNSVFLVYAEEARERLMSLALPAAWNSIVVVHNGIDYHHPVVQSDQVDVTTAVDGIGTTSFTTVTVISTATHRCATVRTVQVVLTADRTASRPWTADERGMLEELIAAGKRNPTEPTTSGRV